MQEDLLEPSTAPVIFIVYHNFYVCIITPFLLKHSPQIISETGFQIRRLEIRVLDVPSHRCNLVNGQVKSAGNWSL